MQVPIDDQTSVADSTPEEAAKNIANASQFNMSPTAYKDMAPDLDKEIEKAYRPKTAEPGVARYVAQSSEHAALASPDIEELNWIEKQFRMIGDYVTDRPTNDRKVIDLNLKKMRDPENFTEDDQLQLDLLNDERQEFASRNYGLDGPLEQLPAKVIAMGQDIATSMGRGMTTGTLDVMETFQPKSLTGMALATGAGILKDAYDSIRAAKYNELSYMTNDDGTPKNIDHETKKNISTGFAVINSAIQQLIPLSVAKTTPFLNKFMNPALGKVIVNNPTMAAALKTIGNIVGSAGVGASAGAVSEMTNIISSEMGKNYDGTEASFINALLTVANDREKYTSQILESALVTGTLAGGISTITGVAGFGTTKRQYQTLSQARENLVMSRARDVTPQAPKELPGPRSGVSDGGPTVAPPQAPNPAVTQSVKIMQFKTAMQNVLKVAKSTKMSETAPAQMTELKKQLFNAAGIRNLFFVKEDLQALAKDPTSGEEIRNFLDPEGRSAAQMNAAIAFEPQKVLELAREYPDILEYMRLNPQTLSSKRADGYLLKLQEPEAKRQEFLKKLGAPVDGESPEVSASRKQALEPVKAVGDVAPPYWDGDRILMSQEDVENLPTFTEAIRKALPKAEVLKYDDAQYDARKSVIDLINDDLEADRLKLVDVVEEAAKEAQEQIEIDRIAADPNIALVEKFKTHRIQSGKKTVSIYSIDPALVPDELLYYLDNSRLKDHGVFVKGSGKTPDEAAVEIGVNSGRELLKILARTPDRKQILKARKEANKATVAEKANESVEIDETVRTKALNNQTKNTLLTMKYMKDQEWPTMAGGIKRIALPLPSIGELRFKAMTAIAKTKVGDLNIQQYRVGERASKRIAVQAILKNEVEKAYMNKEAEALNIEFQRATDIYTRKINRAAKFLAKMSDKKTMRTLDKAGPVFVDAMDELLKAFGVERSKEETSKRSAFVDFLKKMQKEGRGDYSIPDEFSDLRPNASEMTVEQYLLFEDRARVVYHQAKLKARLLDKFREDELVQTKEAILKEALERLEKHPGYSVKKDPLVQDDKTYRQEIINYLRTGGSLISNMEFIVKELDVENFGGFFHELLIERFKGDGKWNEKSGYTKFLKMVKEFKGFVEKEIEAYGKDDFDKIESKLLTIPEFETSAALNHGRMTKGSLMRMWAYRGDPEGYEKVNNNHGVTNEVIQKVLDRELEYKDVILAQHLFSDGFKIYRDETAALERRSNGRSVDWIEGRPNVWRDKVLPGGYTPNRHKFQFTKEAAKATRDQLKKMTAGPSDGTPQEYIAQQYAAEMTPQGRLINRAGSDRPLDFSFRNGLRAYEEIIHDLSYREVIVDLLDILRDPKLAEGIVRVVGEPKYNLMVSTVIEKAGRIQAENANYFSDQGRLWKNLAGHVQSNLSVALLSMNYTSVGVQFTAYGQAALNMGAEGTKYLLQVGDKLGRVDLWPAFYDFAANELDPTIGHFVEGIQNKLASVVFDLAPPKVALPGTFLFLKNVHKRSVDIGMFGMGAADVVIKTHVALAAYMQFMDGAVDNYPKERLATMTPKQVHEKAVSYVRQISRLSLTHNQEEDKAPIQKTPLGKITTNYWNDGRNALNNQLAIKRKAQWKYASGKKKYKEGDRKGSGKDFAGAAGIIMFSALVTAIARISTDKIRGQQTPLDENHDWTTPEGVAKATARMLAYMMGSPIVHTAETTPILRDIKFSIFDSKKRGERRIVQMPMNKALDEVATSGKALWDAAEYLIFQQKIPALSPAQKKSLLFSFSIGVLPLPVNGVSKAIRLLEKSNPNEFNLVTEPPPVEEINKAIDEAKRDASNEQLKEMEAYQAKITPIDNNPPPETLAVIKQIASGGDWSKKDPNSTAAGLYQFTEEQWNDIMTKAPELGLTEEGRTEKSSLEQDLAADWLMKDNAMTLTLEDIPVSLESLYGSHLLGVENYIKVHKAPADTKLKTVIGASERFSQIKTVGAIKKMINEQVEKGRKALTSTAGNSED